MSRKLNEVRCASHVTIQEKSPQNIKVLKKFWGKSIQHMSGNYSTVCITGEEWRGGWTVMILEACLRWALADFDTSLNSLDLSFYVRESHWNVLPGKIQWTDSRSWLLNNPEVRVTDRPQNRQSLCNFDSPQTLLNSLLLTQKPYQKHKQSMNTYFVYILCTTFFKKVSWWKENVTEKNHKRKYTCSTVLY